jgi:dimethyladenosine transferase 1
MDSRKNLFHFGRVPAVLTFQQEVAHRIVAEPNDPERCRLSVICQNYAKVEYMFTLPGILFCDHRLGKVR